MERQHYLRQNIEKKYEQYLSPFGKKVLQVFLNQWQENIRNTRNTDERHHHQLPAQSKRQLRVLTFNNESAIETPYMPPIPAVPCEQDEVYLGEKTFNINITRETSTKIRHSVELIEAVAKESGVDDFPHPTIAANKNLLYDVYNKNSDDDDILNAGEKLNRDKSKDIHWDDALDIELLINANEPDNIEINDNLNISDNIPSNGLFSIVGNNNDKNSTGRGTLKRKIKKSIDHKTKKDSTRNEEGKPQKGKELVKKTIQKNDFRKQKYTKVVKNWLEKVEPRYTVDEDNMHRDTFENLSNIKDNSADTSDKPAVDNIDKKINFDKNSKAQKVEMVIDKPLKAKKVVQAKLANRDGVMKFSKPKHDAEDHKNNTDIKENKPKERNVKKFVPPIKSQVPVRDVSYDVSSIDEDNIQQFEIKLHEISNKEIVATLIYSNGFCQLNSQHTDGTCSPEGVIINADDMFYCFKSAGQRVGEILKHLLENNKVVCYEARCVLIYLAAVFDMNTKYISMYDAKIAASLLDPDNPPEHFMDVQKTVSFSAAYTIATECPLQKCAWYLCLLKECWAKMYETLVGDSLWTVFVDIEMKLLPIIAEMERRGVSTDVTTLKSMEEVLVTRMKLVEQDCYKAANKTFQITSAVQVRAILYDELQLDAKCNVKIRETICKGAKSTSETMLRSLVSEHPLPRLILEYRHLHKAHATFLAGIAQHIKDGVVRPNWVQTAAATGRIASNNPNLQAIPKAPFSLVMFPDTNDNEDNVQLMFRSVYVSRPGHWLLAADFKHVECRVFAHAAADCGLLRALAASHDLFKVLAAQWLKKAEVEIVDVERERTKRLVYASLYGAGTRKLMEILGVSYEQALQVAASFNRTFPSLKWFGRSVVSGCARAGGRLSTLCGRARRFPHICSQDFALKAHAERQAVNFVVQGSAADLCKIAMILTEEALRNSSPAVEAHLVLQIHDELVWEVRDHHVDRAAAIIKQVMEGCGQRCGMSVSLPVAISVGQDWGHMHPYIFNTEN